MRSFIAIDGPIRGQIVESDFRPSIHDGAEYKKTTFAIVVCRGEHRYRVFCDVAYVGELPTVLPGFAIENAKCEAITGDAPEITVDQFLAVSDDGLLTVVEV